MGATSNGFPCEAADDVSYRIIDFEDGFRLGHVSYIEAEGLLLGLLAEGEQKDALGKLKSIAEPKDKVEYLRARAINALIYQVVSLFLDSEDDIVSGRFDEELVSKIPRSGNLNEIRALSKEKVYSGAGRRRDRSCWIRCLGRLCLTYFVPAVLEAGSPNGTKRNAKYFELLPSRARSLYGNPESTTYERLLIATRFHFRDDRLVMLYRSSRL
jgi:dGTPase